MFARFERDGQTPHDGIGRAVHSVARQKYGLQTVVVSGKMDSEFDETTASTTTDNVTAAASATAADNASLTGSDVQPLVYKQCSLVGTGWMFWYPAVRPAFGFVVYYVVPMLFIGVLYGRVVRTLLASSPPHHSSGDREQLKRKQAARSNFHSQLIFISAKAELI